MLRSLCTDSRQLQAVEIIARNVAHLTRMLDDLLDAARLRRGAFTLKKQTVDLAVIVREVLENLQPAIDARLELAALLGFVDPHREQSQAQQRGGQRRRGRGLYQRVS